MASRIDIADNKIELKVSEVIDFRWKTYLKEENYSFYLGFRKKKFCF